MAFDGAQCVATFTTPVRAFCPYTITRSSKTTLTLFYESTIRASSGGETIDRTTVLTNITTLTSVSAVAQPLYVLWQSADLSRFPPAYASSLAKRINVPFTATASPGSSSSLPAQTSPPRSSPEGLNTGAKVGIGIGVSLFVLLIISILAFFLLRRRHTRNNTSASTSQPTTAEMEDQDAILSTRKWYLGGKWRSEAEAKNEPGELDSRNVRVVGGPPAELEGDYGGQRRDVT
jgi:hypothetical protein